MIKFWRGYGWLVPILVVLIMVSIMLLANNILFFYLEGWDIFFSTLAITGLLFWFIGKRLMCRDYILTTGKKEQRVRADTFLFFRVKHWGVLLLVIGGGSFCYLILSYLRSHGMLSARPYISL